MDSDSTPDATTTRSPSSLAVIDGNVVPLADAAPPPLPEYTEPFVGDDAVANFVHELCTGIALQSDAKHTETRVLHHTSRRVVDHLYAALALVCIDRTSSLDEYAAPLQTTTAVAALPNDLSGFQRAIGRAHAFVTQQRHATTILVAQHSPDGVASVPHDAVVAVFQAMPLFLSAAEATFIIEQSHIEHDARLEAAHLAKLTAAAVKAAKKRTPKPRPSSLRDVVVFVAPDETSPTPNDAHAPYELPARPVRPDVSPEKDATTTTSVRGSIVHGRASTRYSVAATIQSHKVATDEVDVHMHVEAPSAPTIDEAAMSNIFSLGTPRQLSPRELARRRDILSYLESQHATAAYEEKMAQRKRAMLERPVLAADAGEVIDVGGRGAVPRGDGEFFDVPTGFAITDATPHDDGKHNHHHPYVHRNKSMRKGQMEKLLGEHVPEPIPDFHLPQIDTNRLEVGVKVVYQPGKEKAGGKRNPSRNSRLKLHNYNAKTPPHPPSSLQLPTAPHTDKHVVLPKLPVSPIKASQVQPPKPTHAPAAPVTLPKATTSPIKPTYVKGSWETQGDATSSPKTHIVYARVRGKQPVRHRFKFSETIFRTLQN
ncbi:Aste57867_21642 [Aphanomyces stellatus]|uniref:Aste57867_21642 protein n=1 Tax=Aphanomyces stellatus TaxID=120398 RepID=A0A485LI21_9STRA|nr:hypothetical protein As57867_021573 [Aphanomyces stellatus]VFT98311.1 Aste57867_21642 [Aphanomyces stellatus]